MSSVAIKRLPLNRMVAILSVALVCAFVLSLAIGPTGISLNALPRALSASLHLTNDPAAERDRLVLFDFRLARTLLAAYIGAALAVAGALMQGLFRNPLADPALIGVSAGAALAAVALIVLGHTAAGAFLNFAETYSLPIAAFAGALATTLILVMVASRHGQLAIGTMLLAGIAIGAIAWSATGFLAYLSDDRQLRDLTLWQMGSLSGASWPKVVAVVPFALCLAVVLPLMTRSLNGFILGEAEAMHLGVNIERTKRLIILATAASVGSAVAVAGIIGFVGLVAPHAVRILCGPDHRAVLPGSALLGATLVIFADVVARMAVAPAEMPIGIVMAAIGAPVFLHLVLKRGIGGWE